MGKPIKKTRGKMSDDANRILREIAIDTVNRLKLFFDSQAPEGFTIDLVHGRSLVVGEDGLIFMKIKEGASFAIPTEAAVAITMEMMAMLVEKHLFLQGYVEGDKSG